MNEFLNQLSQFFKPTLVVIITGVVSICSPIHQVLLLLFLAFLFNIIIGMAADIHAHKKQFCIKKAFEAILQLTFYAALVVFVRFGADLLEEASLGELGVKWLAYVVVYFYMTNILRNASLVFPNNKAIAFLYLVFTTEILNRLYNAIGLTKVDAHH